MPSPFFVPATLPSSGSLGSGVALRSARVDRPCVACHLGGCGHAPTGGIDVTTKSPASRLALIATLVVIAVLAAVPAALADKGGRGGGKNAPVSNTGSLTL